MAICGTRLFGDLVVVLEEAVLLLAHPPVERLLADHGIKGVTHRTRKMTMDYDVIKVMDLRNLRNARRIAGGDPEGRISLLLENGIADPGYTDDFQTAYKDIP